MCTNTHWMEQNIPAGLRLLVSRDHLSWNSTLISQVNIPERCQNGSDFDSAQRTCAHLSGSEFKGAIRKVSLTPDSKIGSHEGKPADARSSAQGQLLFAFRYIDRFSKLWVFDLLFSLASINGAFVFVWI